MANNPFACPVCRRPHGALFEGPCADCLAQIAQERPPACPRCVGETVWVECWECGGEGEHDAYELDPIWYEPGDTEECSQCDGEGGWWHCEACAGERLREATGCS